MKLETWDELEEQNPVFCWSCGKQLFALDEINQRICMDCKNTFRQHHQDDAFFCWACGKKLSSMNEVAQSLCATCRSAILRKLK